MLFKVLVILDFVIYRIYVDRLYNDFFKFFGDVLEVYLKYFIKEFKVIIVRCGLDVFLFILGFVVIIFYEIVYI